MHLRANEIAGFRARLEKEPKESSRKKIELVEGGEHRQQSVANAIASVSATADDIVLVHDAVRPFVTAEIIHNVIEAAEKYGAAIAGMPAMDTIKQVERTAEGAVIISTISRERGGDGANSAGFPVQRAEKKKLSAMKRPLTDFWERMKPLW